MDYQSYDDYMRSAFGFSGMNSQICPNMCMNNQSQFGNMGVPFSNMGMNTQMQFQDMNTMQSCEDLERMYPDTYRVIHPMVVSACNNIRMPVTEDMIEQMTNDIYDRAEMDDRISVDINITVENRKDGDSRQDSSESRQQMMGRPRRRNRFLRDLIRILLLRELIGRRRRFPNRPF